MPPNPPDPFDVQVGKRLRIWRTSREISRTTLGEALGLTEQQIQKYETGANRIGASRLQQICNVLKIPVPFLFEDVPALLPGEGGMPQDMIDFLESEEGVRFVAAFERITDRKMRRGIARLAGRIAEGMQPKALAELPRLREWVDGPAEET